MDQNYCPTGYILHQNQHNPDRTFSMRLAGPGWGKYCIGPLQFGICYGAVIASSLIGGQSLKVSSVLAPLQTS